MNPEDLTPEEQLQYNIEGIVNKTIAYLPGFIQKMRFLPLIFQQVTQNK